MRFYKKNILSENQRSINIKKNIISSLLIKAFNIIISLLLVPITLNFVNISLYGIWITISSIIGWFSFFDLGFTQGLRNRFAEAKAHNDNYLGKIYVSTTYVILSILFLIVSVVFCIISNKISWSKLLNVNVIYEEDLSNAFVYLIIFFSLQMVLKIINTLLTADQKIAKVSLNDLLVQTTILGTIYICSKLSVGSLSLLAVIFSGIPVIYLILASFFYYKKYYRDYIPSLNCVDFKYFKDIISYGGKFFLIQISWILLFQVVNIILLHTTNSENVTLYNIIYKYFNAQLMISTIVIAPYWSAFTEAYTKNDFNWMINSQKKLVHLWKIFVIWIVLITIISPLIFDLWIGKTIEVPFKYCIYMGVYTIVMVRSNIYITLIAGIGKIFIQTILNIIFAIMSIPLLLIMCEKYGIGGAIISMCLMPIAQSFIGRIQLDKILKNEAHGIWNK